MAIDRVGDAPVFCELTNFDVSESHRISVILQTNVPFCCFAKLRKSRELTGRHTLIPLRVSFVEVKIAYAIHGHFTLTRGDAEVNVVPFSGWACGIIHVGPFETNLVFKPGEKDLEGLIASLDRGILVTGFNGGNSNGSTGDFSYGIEGFLIESGKLTRPVSEMNITGNFKQVWNDLVAVGSDVFENSSWRLPSLVFDNIEFSGI